jgi:tetratricopeptide (TPR) repeat protein
MRQPAIVPLESQRQFARLVQWCRQGQVAAAELELNDWRRCPDCPPAVPVLLAALLARRGEVDAALTILAEAGDHDADVLKLRITLLTELGRVDEAGAQTELLHHEHGHDAAIAQWLQAVQAPGADALPIVSDALVETLAGELVGRVEVIPTLVAAQKARSDLRSVRLLRDAIQRMARDVEDARQILTVCQAMADLSLLLGDEDDARRWAHRGLRLQPYYAPLAIILAQVADDPVIGPPAVEILSGASQAHPRYRDVLAALIRRQHAQGQSEAAREKLRQWVDLEPQHPLVCALQRELAA